jgi:hypothetical protein
MRHRIVPEVRNRLVGFVDSKRVDIAGELEVNPEKDSNITV